MSVETMFQGRRRLVIHAYDNYLDANLSRSKIVDVSAFTLANGETCKRVSIDKLNYNVLGGTVTLEWDRDPYADIGTFTGFHKINYDVPKRDGGTGYTAESAGGDILLTTDCIGGSYDIELTLLMHKD